MAKTGSLVAKYKFSQTDVKGFEFFWKKRGGYSSAIVISHYSDSDGYWMTDVIHLRLELYKEYAVELYSFVLDAVSVESGRMQKPPLVGHDDWGDSSLLTSVSDCWRMLRPPLCDILNLLHKLENMADALMGQGPAVYMVKVHMKERILYSSVEVHCSKGNLGPTSRHGKRYGRHQ